MSYADFLLGRPARLPRSTPPARDDDAVVTVRSDRCWIASAPAACFSCRQLAAVVGLVFPADSVIDRQEPASPRPAPAAGPNRYFQLIYVQRISAPPREDIVHLHPDYDPRRDCRYLMNHCDRCGARFSDAKLFEPPDGLFNRHNPAGVRRIEFRRWFGLVLATGCVAPIADHLAVSLDALTGGVARRRGGEEVVDFSSQPRPRPPA